MDFVIIGGKVVIMNSENNCLICYMLDYGYICCPFYFTKVSERQFDGIKIK